MEIQLRQGKLTAKAETLGGELVSLRGAREYIWNGDPAWWTGRNPLLFPIVGSLKEGTVRFDGRPYAMGRHGFARKSEFVPAETGEDYVVYRKLYGDGGLWVRPLTMFLEPVDKKKYPDAKQTYRFELQDIESVAGHE